jgi:hypothetical protein
VRIPSGPGSVLPQRKVGLGEIVMPVPEVVLTAEQKIALFHGVAGWDFEVRRRSHASFDLGFFEVRETPLYAIPSFIFQACFLEEPIYYRHRWCNRE